MLLRLLVFVALTLPLLSAAAGLVPCGGRGEPACQTCHVVELVNGVVAWLVGILGVIAAIIIVYAGFKLVTSGGNTGAKEKAKSLFTNMLIGYTIVLAAWLFIDYGVKALLNEGDFGVWNQVQCVRQPDPIFRELVNGDVTNFCTASTIDGCTAQAQICTTGGGTSRIDSTGPRWAVVCTYAGGMRPPDLSAGGACNSDIIGRHFGDQVGNAQCIIKAESACGASNVSRTDVLRGDGRAFSFGPMQINLTVHELVGCGTGGSTLDCKSAFSGRNYSATVVNEDLYQQCARAAQDTECNIRNGRRIFDSSGWGAWSTAKGCGLRR